MAKTLDPGELQRELNEYLSTDGRRWLADLLHDHLGGRVTNLSLQAEIVLRAWEKRPDMALTEMQDLKKRLDEVSGFLVGLVRAVTPPSGEPKN
jgi:signal transduction histidine kinase